MAICAVNFFSQNTTVPHPHILFQRDQHQSWLSPKKDVKIVFHLIDVCTLMYISHKWCTFKPFEKHISQPLLINITNEKHGKS